MKNKFVILALATVLVLGVLLVGCKGGTDTKDAAETPAVSVSETAEIVTDKAASGETIPDETEPSSGSDEQGNDVDDTNETDGAEKTTVIDGTTTAVTTTKKTDKVQDGTTTRKTEPSVSSTASDVISVLPDGGLLLPDDVWE